MCSTLPEKNPLAFLSPTLQVNWAPPRSGSPWTREMGTGPCRKNGWWKWSTYINIDMAHTIKRSQAFALLFVYWRWDGLGVRLCLSELSQSDSHSVYWRRKWLGFETCHSLSLLIFTWDQARFSFLFLYASLLWPTLQYDAFVHLSLSHLLWQSCIPLLQDADWQSHASRGVWKRVYVYIAVFIQMKCM